LHRRDPETYRILFSFAKKGRAVLLPHLAVIEVFSHALLRSGIPLRFSGGFNPLPRIDFAAPLAMGIFAEAEIATLDTTCAFGGEEFIARINPALPEGFTVVRAVELIIPPGAKKYSTASLLWGATYEADQKTFRVTAGEEKEFRQALLRRTSRQSVFGLTRQAVFAHYPAVPEKPESYFSVYAALYQHPLAVRDGGDPGGKAV
jgi:radical SAM-linked protein